LRFVYDVGRMKQEQQTKENEMTVRETIQTNRDEYLAAKTSEELKSLFQRDGLATQHRWNKAVAAVIELGGVDYYAVRGEQRAATAEALRQQVTHEVELFVDAKARCQRFAITDANGSVVWYGIFFEDDRSFSYGDRNEQSACECAAARKAIWLASKIKEAVNATAIRLHLNVDAQWLTTLAGKATILASDARRFNIELDMKWVEGTSNPADSWTTAGGFKRWNDEPIEHLAVAITNQGEPHER
jgi:hypothetical protein